jgi:hypothetical protein
MESPNIEINQDDLELKKKFMELLDKFYNNERKYEDEIKNLNLEIKNLNFILDKLQISNNKLLKEKNFELIKKFGNKLIEHMEKKNFKAFKKIILDNDFPVNEYLIGTKVNKEIINF